MVAHVQQAAQVPLPGQAQLLTFILGPLLIPQSLPTALQVSQSEGAAEHCIETPPFAVHVNVCGANLYHPVEPAHILAGEPE